MIYIINKYTYIKTYHIWSYIHIMKSLTLEWLMLDFLRKTSPKVKLSCLRLHGLPTSSGFHSTGGAWTQKKWQCFGVFVWIYLNKPSSNKILWWFNTSNHGADLIGGMTCEVLELRGSSLRWGCNPFPWILPVHRPWRRLKRRRPGGQRS